MLKKKYGKYIDKHDAVVRFNILRVNKFKVQSITTAFININPR